MRTLLTLFLAVATSPAVAVQPYEGSWATSEKACMQPDDGNIRITSRKYFEHEGRCTIRQTTKKGINWLLDVKCEGEGNEWTRIIMIGMRGDRLKLDNSDMLYMRCGFGLQMPNWPTQD